MNNSAPKSAKNGEKSLREINAELLISSVRQQELADQAAHSEADLRKSERTLQRSNAGLGETVAALTKANLEIAESRRAALNLIEDAVAARHNAEEFSLALIESERKFREMIDALPTAVYTTDAEGHITHFNPACVELTGRSPEIGSDEWCVSWKLFNPDGSPMPHDKCPMAVTLKTGKAVRGSEAILERPDGTRRWFEPYPTPLYDAKGEITGGINMLVDITDRKLADQALRESEARFRQMADTMPQIVWSARPDGYVDYYNERWYEYTGFPRDSFGQQSWEPILHPEDLHHTVDTYFGCIRGGHPYNIEYRFIDREHGGYRWFMGRALPVRDSSGNIVRWLGTCTDIDDQKRAEEIETRARQDAEAANRMKDEFLSVLSHELRTPLNAILGWVRMYRMGMVDEQHYAQAIDVIERNAALQNGLIEDLLDVSRIISGKMRIEREILDTVKIVGDAVETLRPVAMAKGIGLELSTSVKTLFVECDHIRLQQAIVNLVQNAIKFTPAGGTIRVAVRKSAANAEIQVEDSGIGIDAELLPHIFERFRQADASSQRSFTGLGLGLTIVRTIIELHGGNISAESDGNGKGSVFTVVLPLAADHDRSTDRTLALAENGDARNLSGVKVLLVDDNYDNVLPLQMFLNMEGADVTTASSAAEALEKLSEEDFSLLISDIGMPEMDGFGLISRLRNDTGGRNSDVPAIAVTAYASSEDKKQTRSAGFQSHVSKPIDFNEVVKAVKEVFQTKV